MDLIECQWCHAQNQARYERAVAPAAPPWMPGMPSSDSGWREAPRLRDMTEFHVGNSTAQVEGELVPGVELAWPLATPVFFEHHVLLL